MQQLLREADEPGDCGPSAAVASSGTTPLTADELAERWQAPRPRGTG